VAPDPRIGSLSTLAAAVGIQWRPGDAVAAVRRRGLVPGPRVDAGAKGMVSEVGHGRRCAVRVHSGPVLTGRTDADVGAIDPDLRC
jgi:hypothetical protein